MAKQMQLFPGAFKAFINDVSQIGESEFFLSTRGEGYLSKIPGLRHAAGRMGEAFDQFLDIGKWEWYKSMYPTVSARYGNAGTHELGAAIRNAMGTTSTVGLGVHGSQRAVETFLMFAPRYTRSVFALLSDAVSGGIRGSEARRAIGGLMASAGLVYTAAAHAADQEPDFNPMSSGFMSIRVGDNYIGIPGIARALMGTVTRSINAAITDPSVFYDPRRVLDDPVVRFFQSRTAAGVSDFFDIMIGKDYIGQPTRSSWQDLARVAQGFISPFGIGSWMEVRGDMATHMSVSVASFLLGRTTPVSPSALRNEHVYAWAKGLGVQLTDLNGTKFTPSNYGDLPRYLKDEFDVYAPQDTKRVADWRESNRNVLTEVDQAREQGFSAIAQAGMDLTNQNNAKAYGDFQLYQNRVSTILGDEARTISDYYNKHPFDQTAITKEQQTILDYNNKVLSGPGVQDAFGNIDWNLENVLERQFYQANPEARDIIMRQYTSAMDPIDTERRKVNWFLQDTYYAYMDSIWSPDGMAAFVEPASKWTDSPLPSLGDGRGPLDFGSAVEYQREMDYEFYKQFSDTGIPAALANFPSGGQGSPTVGQLYGVEKPLPVPLAQQATVTIRSRLMKDYWAFNDAIATDYLAQPQNAEILSDMRIWKKTDLPAALEEALTGYTPKKGPAPAAKGTSGAAGLFMP
jgi:hypothetical protein